MMEYEEITPIGREEATAKLLNEDLNQTRLTLVRITNPNLTLRIRTYPNLSEPIRALKKFLANSDS